MRPNLYHDRAETKHARSTYDCIGFLEDLWRGPRRSISVNNPDNPEILQTSEAVMVDKNIELAKGYQGIPKQPEKIPTSFTFQCMVLLA